MCWTLVQCCWVVHYSESRPSHSTHCPYRTLQTRRQNEHEFAHQTAPQHVHNSPVLYTHTRCASISTEYTECLSTSYSNTWSKSVVKWCDCLNISEILRQTCVSDLWMNINCRIVSHYCYWAAWRDRQTDRRGAVCVVGDAPVCARHTWRVSCSIVADDNPVMWFFVLLMSPSVCRHISLYIHTQHHLSLTSITILHTTDYLWFHILLFPVFF